MSLEVLNLRNVLNEHDLAIPKNPKFILPLDIWKIILFYFDPRIHRATFFSFGAVCKTFIQLCVNSIKNSPVYFEHHVFSKMDTLGAINIEQISSIKTDGENLHFLSEANGCYYFRSTGKKYCLYIFLAHSGSFISLDLVEQIKAHVIEKIKPQVNFSSQEILKCFPLDNGFVVITNGGVIVFDYVDKRPVIKSYHSPFVFSGKTATEIYSVGLKKQVLFLRVIDQGNRGHDFFYTLDLSKTAPKFEIYPCISNTILFTLGKRLLHQTILTSQPLTFEIDLVEGTKKDEKVGYHERPCSILKELEPRLGNDRWIVAVKNISGDLFEFNWISADQEKLEKWENRSFDLHVCNEETRNLFLRDDYLFVQTAEKTHLISLFSKVELGLKLQQFLLNINLKQSVIGMWAFLKENKKYLRILVLNRKTSELQLLQMELCKKSEMSGT